MTSEATNMPGETHSGSSSAVFAWYPMGTVKPAGWIREQMLRDLRQGFAGCLDQLCPEASSDIFVTNRNSAKSENTHNVLGVNWWNGETEGNWRAGHMMMAHLSEDPDAMRAADRYVDHILASQDADGYLGVFAPDLRYTRQGELWTQACLFRGLLAYAELAHRDDVFKAVRRAADLTVETYRSGNRPLAPGESHDLMFVDVLERLYEITGDSKYRDFSLWFYDQWSKNESKWDATLTSLLDLNRGFVDHGVHTYENVRVPLWLSTVSDRSDLQQAAHNAFLKVTRYSEVSGSGVSQEWIKDLQPDPSHTEYEYCATKELQMTFTSALQKTGRGEYGDRVERIWFNAAQGARLPDGTAISYLTPDNRFQCDGKTLDEKEPQPRNKFSPTHADAAVCCNPNATQVAALYTRGMWMRDSEGMPVATLYGPCVLSTKIDGVDVRIEERTHYPFEWVAEFLVRAERPVKLSLRFRNPSWSKATHVTAAGATVAREGDYWRVGKVWRSDDVVRLQFTPQIEVIKAVNGEVAVSYGPLLFAEELPSHRTVVKRYKARDLEDSYYLAALNTDDGPLDLEQMHMRPLSTFDALHPFDKPSLEIEGQRLTGADRRTKVTLVPLGNAPALRRLTFPIQAKSNAKV